MPVAVRNEPPGRRLPAPLAAAGAFAGALALLLLVGNWLYPRPGAWERDLLLRLHGAGPAGLRRAMTDVTALGSGTVLTIVVVAVAGLLLARRLWLSALLVAAGCWSGGQAVRLVKGVVGRARPDVVEPLIAVDGLSFPSGHAANGAIVYLTAAALATQVIRDGAARAYLLAAAAVLVGAIGVSRVYLGVHWPSDVLAGWSFGTLWALGWWWLGARARAAGRA